MRLSQMLRTTSLAITIAGVAAPVVGAQDMHDRYLDIQRQYANDHTGKKHAAVQLYPNATRAEPGLGISKGMQEPINQLLALVNGIDSEDEAIATGEQLAADNKANPYDRAIVFQALGYAHQNKGDSAKGIAYMQKSLDENTLSNNEQYPLMVQLAKAQAANGQPDAGLATLARVVAETRQDEPEYDGMRGRMDYLKKDYANAAPALQKFVDGSKTPDPVDQQMLLDSYVQLKQPERAGKVGEDILHAHPDDKQAILRLASIYQRAGQNDKTLALLDDARKRGLLTTAADYRELYILSSSMKGHENDSVAVITDGLQKQMLPPNAEVYSKLAEDYYVTNRIPQAIDAYRKADDASLDGEAALNLAKMYVDAGNPAEAKAAARRALQKGIKHPDEARSILDRGKSGRG